MKPGSGRKEKRNKKCMVSLDDVPDFSKNVPITKEDREYFKYDLQGGRMEKAATSKIQKNLDALENARLDIAVTGESGSGKSSFVNAIRGLGDEDDGSAPTGVVETTLKPVPYPYPKHPNVTVWDLPGIGTPRFKSDTYLQDVSFSRYDFFIIIASERFKSTHAQLALEIQKMGKRFYFVRCKVDVDLEASKRRRPRAYDEEEILRQIRNKCQECLEAEKVVSPRVFLLSNWELNKYDFKLFEKTLRKELPSHKRHAFLLALPNISPEILQKKKEALQEQIWKLAAVSCALATVPIPGVGFACDVPILVCSISKYRQVFGLDKKSLTQLADKIGQPVEEIKAVIKSPLSQKVSKRLVLQMFSRASTAAVVVVEYFASTIPIFGSLAAGAIAFGTTYYVLWSILNQMADDAHSVLTMVLQSDYEPKTQRTKMGVAISKTVVRAELESMKIALEKNNPQDVSKRMNEELNLLKSTTLDIGITGVSGAGKSSIVNALRGITEKDPGAAKTGNTETTMEPEKYTHPMFPEVTMWDLPGIGTPKFKAKEYLRLVNFEKYDFFIIVASERFTENDVLLAKEMQKKKKKYYFVRSKVDQSVNADKRNADFNEEKTCEKIRQYCCDNLTEAGESNPRVFLISSWDLKMYDFPLLQETLSNDLDDLKKYALIVSMPAFSREVLEKKKAAMETLIWKVALVSCGIGAIPVPGLSLACDIGILVGTMIHFCKVFGLDEDCLCRLASRVGKPIDELKSAVKKAPMASQVTTEFVIDLMTKSLVCGAVMAVEFALDFVPVLGSLTGGALSFVTTFYLLKSFLHDVEEDAENVLAKAMETQDK
ncbi:uncharacterized protein LOC129342974 [Eublepharis macularius]|uniref:Uncharacterized protein LOC129342974 n=1 Tax=Eublepharis macularius TaxID=481883 RepID=A0AA97KFE1_EUBMA|nr:uncharacterized protein LOC129342974 [Eublepharis macularius]